MQKLVNMFGEFIIAILSVFSPLSKAELRENFKAHVADAMKAAQEASAAKRKEMEDELAEMSSE